jgi:hypothetical protein
MKTLCDRCKREYESVVEEGDEKIYNKYFEFICPDCEKDLNED